MPRTGSQICPCSIRRLRPGIVHKRAIVGITAVGGVERSGSAAAGDESAPVNVQRNGFVDGRDRDSNDASGCGTVVAREG